MATRSIIEKLHKAINKKQSQDVINVCTDVLAENITDATEEPIFYSLPFDQITNTIKKVEFLNPDKVKDPLALLQTIIQQTSEAYPEEAVLLLNVIKVENLPPLLPDDIIPIISKFTNCELLTKLGDLHEYNKHLLIPDNEGQENEELKQKIDELHKKIKELEEQKKSLQERGSEEEFQPISEKPKDFEENVFDAVEKGKIDSVRYHFEVLHADIKKTCDLEITDYGKFEGLTAVHIAAACGQLDIVRYFYEVRKVDKEIRTAKRLTPLHIAAACGQLPIVQYLCEIAKVNKEAIGFLGNTALHYASENGHLSVVRYLCEVAKVNKEVTNQYGRTALHSACSYNQLPVVDYLCEVAKVNTEGSNKFARSKEVNEYLKKYLFRARAHTYT